MNFQSLGPFLSSLLRQLYVQLYYITLMRKLIEGVGGRLEGKLAENAQKGSHTCTINGRTYKVFPQVFSPAIFISSQWTTNSLIKHLQNVRNFLEIGVGSGVTMIEVLLAGRCDYALGTDISESAVLNTRQNLKIYGLHQNVIESDVLDNVSEDLKFDVIYWNFPCVCTEGEYQKMSTFDRMVKDPHYSHLQKLLLSGKKYLSEGGRVYLGFSHSSGDEQRVNQLCNTHGWSYSVVQYKQTVVNCKVHSVSILQLLPI